jgi:hypothetical protein
MAICGCGLPAPCCQPAVAGGVIYAGLWGELSTHLTLQALFTQSSPVREPLLQAFPFPSTLGEVTLQQLSPASLFIYSSMGDFPSPLFRSQGAPLSLLCVLFIVIVYYSVCFSLFFPRVGVSLSRQLC